MLLLQQKPSPKPSPKPLTRIESMRARHRRQDIRNTATLLGFGCCIATVVHIYLSSIIASGITYGLASVERRS